MKGAKGDQVRASITAIWLFYVISAGFWMSELLSFMCFRVKEENQGQEVHLVIKGRQ